MAPTLKLKDVIEAVKQQRDVAHPAHQGKLRMALALLRDVQRNPISDTKERAVLLAEQMTEEEIAALPPQTSELFKAPTD